MEVLLFPLLIALAVFLWMAFRQPTKKRSAPSNSGPRVVTSWEIREIDESQPRFGGTARPEFRVTYVGDDGAITEREIYVHSWREADGTTYYRCWCFLRNEERTLRGDRMQKIINLDTGRPIKDIGKYRTRY